MLLEYKSKATKYLRRLDLCYMVKHLQKHFGKDELVGLIKTQTGEERPQRHSHQSMVNVGEARRYGVMNHAHSI